MKLSIVLIGVLVFCGGCAEGLFPDARYDAKGNVKVYQQQLESNLLHRYNSMPRWAGKISKVELVLPHPPEQSKDGRLVKVEFDQLVYDNWGGRIPELEQEYFMITFGDGQPQIVRTTPSVTVGLKSRGSFSESSLVETGQLGASRTAVPPMPAAPVRQAPSALPIVVPTAPVVTNEVVPTLVTEGAPVQNHPSLLQGMVPPRLDGVQRPRATVRNLPPEPELDDLNY